MPAIHLFNIAARQAEWLSTRQAAIARNIANADTPGFKATDTVAFESVLERTELSLARTDARHFAVSDAIVPAVRQERGGSWDTVHSGNNVSLENELIKLGDGNRAYALNTGVTKAFHRMMLTGTKT